MFPPPSSATPPGRGGDDATGADTVRDGSRQLRVAYWLIVVAAVVMLVTSMALLTQGVPEDLAPEQRSAVRNNVRVSGFGGIVLALGLAVAAPQLRPQFGAGSRVARRWAAGLSCAAIFLSLASFVLRLTSWASFVAVVLLTLALFFMFRPAANRLVGERFQ